MRVRYVLDTGALVAAERKKQRVAGFFQLAHQGSAHLLVPLPVVAEWWRGRSAVREAILAATEVVSDVVIAQAAGNALAKQRSVNPELTIDAIVMATAALRDAIVVTHDPRDFATLSAHFPGVAILSI